MLAKRMADAQVGSLQNTVRKEVEKQESLIMDTIVCYRLLPLACIIVVGLVVSIFLHGMKQTTAYEVVDGKSQVIQLTKERDLLQVEVTEMKSPTRIQKIAQENLGMVLPSSFVYSTKTATEDRDARSVR